MQVSAQVEVEIYVEVSNELLSCFVGSVRGAELLQLVLHRAADGAAEPGAVSATQMVTSMASYTCICYVNDVVSL